MKRRDLLRSIMMASGVLATLPSWAREWDLSLVSHHPSSFSFTEEKILTAITDTIIPESKGIGAVSTGVNKFLQKLFDNCYEEPVRDNIRVKMKELNENARKAHSKTYPECSQEQREKLLLEFASSSDKDSREFFDLVKSETIRGFSTSKPVLVNYLNYKIVPGHYYGCVDVNS